MATDPIVELLGKINDRLDNIDARLDEQEAIRKLSPGGAPDPNATPLPEGIPAPGAHANGVGWGTMTEDQRLAWIRAHEGLVAEERPAAEWEEVELHGGTGAQFPASPQEVKDEWAQQAPSIFENWAPAIDKGLNLDVDGMVEAYGKGGPLWLAAYAHDFLMALPYNWRQMMVKQVASYAPVSAGEFARDVLRVDTDTAGEWAYDKGLVQADKRLKGIVEGRS